MTKKKKPRYPCSCTNHLGGPKQSFKTRDKALSAILSNHLMRGPAYTVYECPESDRFHIATRR